MWNQTASLCSFSITIYSVPVFSWENVTYYWCVSTTLTLGWKEHVSCPRLGLTGEYCSVTWMISQCNLGKTAYLKSERNKSRKSSRFYMFIYEVNYNLCMLRFYFEGPILLGWCANSQQNRRRLPVPRVQWKCSGKILSCFSKYCATYKNNSL